MEELKYLFDNKMNEECGVFGVFNHKNAAELTYFGLHALQHRGQEGAGIITDDNGEMLCTKGEGLVKSIFKEGNLKNLNGKNSIGHVRYSTAGGGGLVNVQPFLFRSKKSSLGLAHNGNLVNADLLKEELEDAGALFQTTSDSEIVAHLIKRHKGDFIERIKKSVTRLDGAFAFVFLKDNKLYATLDKYGLRPLSIGKLGDAYILSSETCAFSVIGAEFIRDVKPGEIIEISEEGIKSTFYTEDVSHNICSMEYIYFSRPDSDIEGINVHSARKESGKRLFRDYQVKADVVIGVPDSGMSAAIGYAEESSIPFEMGLIKNKYSGRSFIEPTQELREIGVKMKLSAVISIVKDKDIIVIDDSMVRGTTSKKLIQILKDAGAKKVHMMISAPEIKAPCFYGVDFSTSEELISAKKSVDEVAEYIGADSLHFLSVESLIKSIGRNHPNGGQCTACFNRKYPTKLYKDLKEANKIIK